MEGVGSRLGRASSRYGPSATATVFNGPVRKWKKKWVHVSSPSSSTANHHNSHSQSNGNNSNNSRLLLCRWTPLSSATDADAASEEPPKRKFRYTPIAVLEERGKTAKMVDHEAKTAGTNQFAASQTSKNDELSSDATLKAETQDTSTSNLDLGLCLKGHNDDPDSVGQTKDGQVMKSSSGGLWTSS